MALTLPRLLSGGLTLALVAAGVALPARARRARAEPPAAERSAREAPRGVAAGATTSGVPADITKILAEIKAADKDLLAVSEEDGRFLRLLAASSRAQHALEIGGANGYSAIWIGMGLRAAGGKLTSIEYDAARAKSAAENIRRAGLSDVVTVVPGDAFQQIPKLAGTFDFVFLDAWKRDYKRFFDMVFPRMTPHGLFLAHNVVNKASEMKDFIDAIEHNPAAMTSIVSPGSEGMSVTLKIGG
jgi:predicted O-methyltransferase YrrM